MKRFIFAGVLVFLIVLIVTFPARVAYKWLAPPDVRLSGISGSVWNGSASEGLAAGAYFRNLSWQTSPLSLLTGKVALALAAQPASGTFAANVAIALDGTLTLTDVSGTLPLNQVHDAFRQAGIQGDMALNFETLVLHNGRPVTIDGSVTITNFFVPELSATRLGDYRADFQTEDGNVTASVDDVSGVLDVAGMLTLAADQSYSLVGQVAARPEAPPSVNQRLQINLGSPDERGLRTFRIEGIL